jgi:ABC-type bacteriocin/lantibiotic exporter with double-glycine peptidase domain
MNLFPYSAAKRGCRWLAPEVVQTSVMDCGPAALKCLLEGFQIPASYGRLREACQTSVDGTSIDAIETVARQLGLNAEQMMLPRDYLWITEAGTLPAMLVVRRPDGANHFVVVWRRHGRWLQIMDPAVGRRWVACDRFVRELFLHNFPVPATDWYEWAISSDAREIFMSRLRSLGASPAMADGLVNRAQGEATWHAMAALDAAARMLGSLVAAGGLRRGTDALRLLESLLTSTAQEAPGDCQAIPAAYWSVVPAEAQSGDEDSYLILRGAVLLRVRGRLPLASGAEAEDSLTPELAAALSERPARPARDLWALVRADGILTPLALMGAVGLAMGALMIEALLFRGFFELARDLNVASQRVGAFAALLSFMILLWMLELPIISESLRLGRHLEGRLRWSLMQKLPRLNDRYFQSRPVSDMAERSHSLYLLRYLPQQAMQFVQSAWESIFTLIGIGFIAPASLPPALGIAGLTVVLSAIAQPLMSERDLRVRSHAGALQSFYLDALLGIVPIRTHSAERSVRRGHEGLLVEWARSAKSPLRLSLLFEGVRLTGCLGLAGWLLFAHVQAMGITGNLLLLVYWVLKLPPLGERLAAFALQYPAQRNIALRLLEPINAPEETASRPAGADELSCAHFPKHAPPPRSSSQQSGLAIEICGASVIAAGHAVLRDVQLSVRPGEHIAIIGPSGAGKSSLLGLLLGWHRAVGGEVYVDGVPLAGERLPQLRRETAWVDPAIQLWNRSLLENLRYSATAGAYPALGQILESADLGGVLARLPEGLQSSLGEGGARLSGGEGQRVRSARALWQRGVRLALLDEPFRGLDREQRRRHLAQARRFWREATLICVTHDVWETRSFDRVVVVENGSIVEDGRPEELAIDPNSRYRNLLDIEESLRKRLWDAPLWRRMWLEGGRMHEVSSPPASSFRGRKRSVRTSSAGKPSPAPRVLTNQDRHD